MSMLLALAVVLSFCALPTFAEETGAVAKIGTTEYTTLGDALGAATDDQTIEILKDFSETMGYTVENKTVTIDL